VFGNTAGGVILLGVEDGSCEACGVEDSVLIGETLVNQIINGAKPQLVLEIEILPWRKTLAVAVGVHVSPNRPHHVTKLGVLGGVVVRVGLMNRKVDEGCCGQS
jgi:predicted HTH transcriptional regulator